ncbi:MAG: CusA/CzcA family heavy metal efflux RND transporter [Polyangiaceae bacterium]
MIDDILLRFSLKNRFAVAVFVFLLAAAGYFAYTQLTIEAFPDPTDTQVQIITLFPGQPTEEVERRVSLPLERALNGTPSMSRLRSISLFGLSFVTLTFEDGADVMRARQQVSERIAGADLPTGVQPALGPLATPIGEVYRYTLDSKTSDPMTLRTLQDWTVRPYLLQTPGVADVVVYGGLQREIQVEPDPRKMVQLGVDLTAVFDALQQGSSNATGGYVERGSEMFVIRSLGIFRDLSDIEDVCVGYHDGIPVTVRDVAQVREGYTPRQGVVTRDDNEDAVEGIVLMRRGENPTIVLGALRQRIDELNGRILPKDVRVNAFYDRTELVDTTLKTVFHNLAEGAFLVTLVLFVFLLDIRAALIVAFAIPLSLASAFIYLSVRGMSVNLLSMGAVDFGIIVDGAVILVEHLYHRLAPHKGHRYVPIEPASLPDRIYHAAREVARPTLFSLLIIIAAYIPIFSLQRVEGRIFSPLAHTIMSALIGALLVRFTLVPLLTMYALRKPRVQRDSPVLVAARRVYEPVLEFAMRQRTIILVLAIGALASALVLANRIGSEFLPELNEGALYVTFTLPKNTSLTEGRALTPRIKSILKRTPEVTSLLSQLGRPEDGTDAKLPNNLEIFVKLKPLHEWRKDKPLLDDLVAEMTKNLEEIPGIEYNFSQPIRDNVNENISGQQGQIAVKVFGDDLEQLLAIANKAKEVIDTVPGSADVGIVKSSETPQLAVKINRKALARWNLSLQNVQNYIETAMGGHVASELWDGEKRFDVTVRLPVTTREDIQAIREVRIPLQDGSLIPLSAVAEVTMGTGRAAITRENGRRYVGIRMNVRNRDLGTFVKEAQDKVSAAIPLPPGYLMTWGGEFENQQRAMARLQVVLPATLLITFLLLYSAFGSFFDAALILINVPFALIGGVFGLAAAHMTLSVSAAVGFIALIGQATLNGVLVVTAVKNRLAQGEGLYKAVVEGTKERLRAVLMIALLASLGLVPAAMSHEIGSETQRPIAVVVVGGTISAAVLTLVVLPVTYYIACTLRDRLRARDESKDVVPQPS